MEPSRDPGAHTDTEGLYLLRPDPAVPAERPGWVVEAETDLVGVVVRGRARSQRRGGVISDDVLRQFEQLFPDRPLVAEPIGTELIEPDTNRLAVGEESRAETGRAGVELTVSLLDQLIEAVRAQLDLLTRLRDVEMASGHERVTLQTATGTMRYTLPLSVEDTYSSTEVGEILSPTGKGHRTTAQNRRRANELLGVKIGGRYRYPKFQIDQARREIRPVVAHANRLLECDADPWGSLDWWFSGDEGLNGRRPIDLLENHELSTEVVDFVVERSQQGMD